MDRGRCAEVAEDWSCRTLEVSGFTLSSPDSEGREVVGLITLIYHIIPQIKLITIVKVKL
jgi:hypothetical protein